MLMKSTWAFSCVVFVLLVCIASCQKRDTEGKQDPHEGVSTVSVSSKLKQGLAGLVQVYDREGEQSAIVFAEENGMAIEGNRVSVRVYTMGTSSDVFVDDLRGLGIDQFRVSSLNNAIHANVTMEQLAVLAEQDFVVYVAPTPKTYIVP